MAGLSDLSVEELMALYEAGLLRDAVNLNTTSVNADGAVSANAKNYSFGPAVGMSMGNVGTAIPVDGGKIRGGVSYQANERPDGRSNFVMPNVGINLGPASLNYSAGISDTATRHNVGAGYDFGPFAVNYSHGFADERMKPTNSINVSAPVGGVRLNAGVMQGGGGPTQFRGGVSVPGLLNGDFDLAASYSPEDKRKAVFGRYSKRF